MCSTAYTTPFPPSSAAYATPPPRAVTDPRKQLGISTHARRRLRQPYPLPARVRIDHPAHCMSRKQRRIHSDPSVPLVLRCRTVAETAQCTKGGYLSNSGSEWRSTGETKPPAARPEGPSDGESHARPVFGAPCPVRRARRRGRAQPDLSRYPPCTNTRSRRFRGSASELHQATAPFSWPSWLLCAGSGSVDSLDTCSETTASSWKRK